MSAEKTSQDFFNEGAYAFARGDFQKSIDDFSRAIENDPDNEKAHLSRGVAYAKIGRIEEAMGDFDKAIDINPKNEKAYHFRGLGYMHRGENEKAVQDFDQALAANPQYAAAYYSRGTVHSELGNEDRAGRDMEMAARYGEANLQAFADMHNIWRTTYHKVEAEVMGDRDRDVAVTPDLTSWFEED